MQLKSSYQRELDKFCKVLLTEDYDIRQITKGAFTQARAKLNPYAFYRLSEIAVKCFYDGAPYAVWEGFRVLAVDGSRLKLPNSKSIASEFGVHYVGAKADSAVSLATCSILYDVLNQIPIDAQIAPWSESEGDLLEEHHMKHLKKGDLLLADRGYPSKSLMLDLLDKGVEFCFRIKEDWWTEIRAFNQSLQQDQIVKIPIKKKMIKGVYSDAGEGYLTVRLIRIDLGEGKIEILCTSLLDQEKYEYNQFKALYHERWGVEEAYKLLKSRIEIEAFSGKTARSVHQDFHAKILMMTLCATLSFPIEEKVRNEYKKEKTKNKHDQQVNKTHALSVTKAYSIDLFFKGIQNKVLDTMDYFIEKTREIVRPGRSEKRKFKPKKLHHVNYKSV